MDRLNLLNTLLERERETRDAALAEWREAERQALAAREQADSLVAYRGEYRKRWAAQFAQRAPIEILHCYQGFVDRLEQAIGAQQGVADQASTRVQAARARLRHRETKVATVQRLIERR
ncbi:MAG TPA: flagellar export protein FliJ, partial [Ideonella sp.]|nr:flagellar export protein FliJ [Ideonella sp.]